MQLVRALPLLALLLVMLTAPPAWADRASGTWSGSLRGDLHYYYEQSTRVFLPTGGIQIESPFGLRLQADYLVDVITSASVGAGRQEDQLQDEYRHEPQLGVGYTFDTGGVQVDLDAVARYSTENDYESVSAGLDAAFHLNDKNTVLRVGGARLVDSISSNADPTFAGSLKAWAGNLAIEQVLNPTMVLTVGYQFGHQWGYLGNPYRFAQRQAAPERERPPRLRVRHGLSARYAVFIPPAEVGVHLMQRLYVDSWNLKGSASEIRVYREFGDLLLLRVRYRYYTQSQAEFYRDSYTREWEGPITSDPKLAQFNSHTLGGRIELSTGFLSETFLGFAADSVIYLQLDHVWTGIPRYGDQVTGTGGGILHF